LALNFFSDVLFTEATPTSRLGESGDKSPHSKNFLTNSKPSKSRTARTFDCELFPRALPFWQLFP